MLPPANRLRRDREFSAVYRKGIRRNSRHLTLRALRDSNFNNHRLSEQQTSLKTLPATRIGISISLKVSKLSVVRNRIKRQIRAALRQMLPRISPGWNLVIVVRPTAQECNYGEFLQQLEQLLVEAEVLNGN
ncbi:ribonuclease P protein component [Oscillatoriales cyanobacterium USR001]|nr:ribonuclease P protein component [Oscillatoriales cyanobacterium USR001]